MKLLRLSMLIGITISAMPAFAFAACVGPSVISCRPAPAPLIGAGIPAVLAIGGAMLGAKYLRRRRG
jgi:hypothetical protein